MWFEILVLVESIQLTSEWDAVIWAFESRGQYSVPSLYAAVNFRGIQPVYTPAVWKSHMPPRTHVFLLLLANNKLLTHDNLSRRREVQDLTCLFCTDHETVNHLFL